MILPVTVSADIGDIVEVDFTACYDIHTDQRDDPYHAELDTHGWQINQELSGPVGGGTDAFRSIAIRPYGLEAVNADADRHARALAIDFHVPEAGFYQVGLYVASLQNGATVVPYVDDVQLLSFSQKGTPDNTRRELPEELGALYLTAVDTLTLKSSARMAPAKLELTPALSQGDFTLSAGRFTTIPAGTGA